MIKFNKEDFKTFELEFKNGNCYMLSKCNISNLECFSVIKTISGEGEEAILERSRITVNSNHSILRTINEQFREFNWIDWSFYILNIEEAAPYLKETIVKSLEEDNEK